MDKTIQLVVVAMIALIAALILAFLLQNQTGSFTKFLGSQKDDASCQLKHARFQQALNCGTRRSVIPGSAESIKQKAQEQGCPMNRDWGTCACPKGTKAYKTFSCSEK